MPRRAACHHVARSLERAHGTPPPASSKRDEETNNLSSLTDETRRHFKTQLCTSTTTESERFRCLNPVSNFSDMGVICVLVSTEFRKSAVRRRIIQNTAQIIFVLLGKGLILNFRAGFSVVHYVHDKLPV
jgi:hypothetical protein